MVSLHYQLTELIPKELRHPILFSFGTFMGLIISVDSPWMDEAQSTREHIWLHKLQA
jgi:hypothetical protein